MKSVIAILVLFNLSLAHANFKSPTAAVKTKIQKLALEHVAVKAILATSASVVMMDQKKCSLEATEIQGELQSGYVTGSIKLNQICDNVEMDGSSNTRIEVTISADRALIDKVEIGYSGF